MASDDDFEGRSRTGELGELIAAPIIGTIKADFLATRAFFRILERYCFVPEKPEEEPDEGESPPEPGRSRLLRMGQLRMVTFTFLHTNVQGFRVPTRVRLPLISMIPLPMLQVKRADYQYDLRIKDRIDVSDQGRTDLTRMPPLWCASWASLVEQTTPSEALKANIRANIVIEQANLPAGIAATLNLMNDGVETAPVGGSMDVSPAVMDVRTGNPKQSYLLAVILRSASSADLARAEVLIELIEAPGTNPTPPDEVYRAFQVFAIVGEVTQPWGPDGLPPRGTMKIEPRNNGQVELAFFVVEPKLLVGFEHLGLRVTSKFDQVQHERTTIMNIFHEG